MVEHADWREDVSPADWLVERLHGFAQDIGSFVPEGFGGYARIFHPVWSESGPKRWSEVARENGRIVHREMQITAINHPVGTTRPGAGDTAPGPSDCLPRSERAVLVETLKSATTTPARCWFCVWEGFGTMPRTDVAARVRLPGRNYLLTEGPIDRAIDSFFDRPSDQCANIWWPDDHAWVVATEIDFEWTYLAAAADVIAALVGDPRIEAMEAQLSDRFTIDGDVINEALDG